MPHPTDPHPNTSGALLLWRRSLLALACAVPLLGAAWAADANTGETLGEVRKVDASGAKITLKHGEIKSIDMPPMTMMFRVKDKALLDGVNPGDKVRFTVEKIGGQYIITTLTPVGK